MNYLPGNLLEAIFRVRCAPCFDAHAQVIVLISQYHRRQTSFLPFLLAINKKCLQIFTFQAISKSKFKNRCCDRHKAEQRSPKCAVGERIMGSYNLRIAFYKVIFCS